MGFVPNQGVLISTGGRGCAVAVGPDHAVYVFYLRGTGADGMGGNNTLYVRRSVNRGVSFQPERTVAILNPGFPNGDLFLTGGAHGIVTNSMPRVAVNPVAARGYLYVAYNDDPGGDNFENGDIFLVRSVNGGSTWSAPLRVNDDTAGDQFHPSISIDANGEDALLSYYSRSDAVGGDLFHRRARLGRLTSTGTINFAQSFRLSPNMPFRVGEDFAVTQRPIGELEQASGGINSIPAIWTDTRLPSAVFQNQPDVRFAQIALPAPASDLGVTVTSRPASPELGDTLIFSVEVTATGGEARDVFLNFAPVTGTLFRSLTRPAGVTCQIILDVGGCSLGVIPAGASKVIVVRYDTIYDTRVRTFRANATASGRDANLANNTATRNVTVGFGDFVLHNLTTGDVALSFDDANPLTIPFDVVGPGKIVQVTARVRLDHSFMPDVKIEVEAPNGERVLLASSDGRPSGGGYGSGANGCAGTPTTFSDLATKTLSDGDVPFDGLFKPRTPFVETFLAPAAGTWNVHFTDSDPQDGGIIGCVRLHVTRAP